MYSVDVCVWSDNEEYSPVSIIESLGREGCNLISMLEFSTSFVEVFVRLKGIGDGFPSTSIIFLSCKVSSIVNSVINCICGADDVLACLKVFYGSERRECSIALTTGVAWSIGTLLKIPVSSIVSVCSVMF